MGRENTLQRALELHREGRVEAAAKLYEAVVENDPGGRQALYLLAVARQQLNDLEGAARAYRRLLEIDPGCTEAAENLALAEYERGADGPAEEAARIAIAAGSRDYLPHLLLGHILLDKGRGPEALEHHRKAASLAQDQPEPLIGQGNAHLFMGRNAEALDAFAKAAALDPESPDAANNLGVAAKALGDLPKAEAQFRRAIELEPGFADAWENLGNALRDGGRIAEARQSYAKAIEKGGLDGGVLVKQYTMLPVIPASAGEIQTARLELAENLEAIRARGVSVPDPYVEVGCTPFYLAYHGLNDRELAESLAATYLSVCPELAATAPHIGHEPPRQGRVKVGVVSSLLKRHTIGKLFAGLVSRLDPEKIELTIFGPAHVDDPVTRELAQAAAEFVPLPDSLPLARQAISERRLDLLLYTDVGMHALTYFLAFARLARVQCATWGHPDTTGIPAMDHFISARDMEPPGSQDAYSEKLVRFTHPALYFRPPAPPAEVSRQSLGLPENKNLYLCPQSLFKLHPDFDRPLARILELDPLAQLVFIHGGHPLWAHWFEKRLTAAHPAAKGRLTFLPRLGEDSFLALLATADALLDSWPFGGGNTSLEAFAVGAPVVTLPGDYARGRITLAFYQRMGFTDLIARTPEDFAQTAVRLATDQNFNIQARAAVRERAPILFEDADAVRELEDFIIRAARNQWDSRDKEEG